MESLYRHKYYEEISINGGKHTFTIDKKENGWVFTITNEFESTGFENRERAIKKAKKYINKNNPDTLKKWQVQDIGVVV